MLIDPLSDGHVHTSLCNHAVGTMEEYVLSAIEKGLEEIIFLEHMEEGIRTSRITWLSEKNFDHYFDVGRQLQHKYFGKIRVGLGVEVGYNPQCREILLKRLSQRKWDRIGVSYHFHKNSANEDHLNLLSKRDPRVLQLSQEEAFEIEERYYKTLIEAIHFLPGTVICHLDAVLRYNPLKNAPQAQLQLIDKLLDSVKEKGMALEVNTSGKAIRKEFFPSARVVAMARAKGIPLVAGSDAHKPEDVGNHFVQLNDMLS